MLDINIKKLSKSYLDQSVFEDIDLELKKGDKVALIGENGTGKTTLLKIIAGEEEKTSGDLFIRKNIKIGYLKQIPSEYGDKTVIEVLLTVFQNIFDLKSKLNEIEKLMISDNENNEIHLKEYGKIHEEYDIVGGYRIQEKLSKICQGLNYKEDFLNKSYSVLSGGEKLGSN